MKQSQKERKNNLTSEKVRVSEEESTIEELVEVLRRVSHGCHRHTTLRLWLMESIN